MTLNNKTILLIVTGSIAACKAPDLVRLLVKDGARVIPVLTKGGEQFVTPLTLQTLAGEKVYSDLFSLTDEVEMGHIKLSRMSDCVMIAPASANVLAKMAHGLADDLASALLLANTRPVLCAPAMNPQMLEAAATQDNINVLRQRGIVFVGPVLGDVACHEDGVGRMAEPADIVAAMKARMAHAGALKGLRVIVTAGPTVEAIDPVRFISNRSSGKQGCAIAQALAQAGADVTLVHGPMAIAPPRVHQTISVESALDMRRAVEDSLPADVAVCAAAVADWRVKQMYGNKIKKGDILPVLALEDNPDILASLCQHEQRPRLVIGFAAETDHVEEHARAKLAHKQCDWLLANDVSGGVFGAEFNQILFLSRDTVTEVWDRLSKSAVAEKLIQKIISYFK